MIANKKPRTSYAELPQETKNKRNEGRRVLHSNLGEVTRAQRNERRRLAYAKEANIYPEIPNSKKSKCNERYVEATQIADPNNLEVVFRRIPAGIVSTDQNSMQTSCVVGVLQEVSQISVHCSATSVNEIGEF